MIPLRDDIPAVRPPVVVVLLILANAIAFWRELGMGHDLAAFLDHYALIPARLASALESVIEADPRLARV